MSTQKGNHKKSGQKYQNSFAYTHNNKSKLTEKILSMPNDLVCKRCHDMIEWKKKYRKYKPLTQPKKCVGCEQKAVTKAYHVLCDPCALKREVCGKCLEKKEVVTVNTKTQSEIAQDENDLKNKLRLMSERKRRAFFRAVERGEDENECADRILAGIRKVGENGENEDFSDVEDSEEDSEGEGRAGQKKEEKQKESDTAAGRAHAKGAGPEGVLKVEKLKIQDDDDDVEDFDDDSEEEEQ
eukprot:comp19430_c0_seq1/m.22541 comp19430_c0_seq1/g.22541  ORF comp19430_c0_seq1/g.22541 comp19430_c0_seq1/m.22541 type:complete len:240 (-) comp19430_c0_seq1:98-817(-)